MNALKHLFTLGTCLCLASSAMAEVQYLEYNGWYYGYEPKLFVAPEYCSLDACISNDEWAIIPDRVRFSFDPLSHIEVIVNSISLHAFAENPFLTDIVIPSSVEEITIDGADVKPGVMNIYFESHDVPNIPLEVFDFFPNCRIHVPLLALGHYKNAWEGISNRIDAEPFDYKPFYYEDNYYRKLSPNTVMLETGSMHTTDCMIPVAFVENDQEYYVAGISPCAFQGNKALERVYIPAYLTRIGNAAFAGCTNLEEAVLPEALNEVPQEMFFGCNSLRSINIPEGVTTINQGAFMESGLISITLPTTVKTLGLGAFADCYNLCDINLNEGLQYIEEINFRGCKAYSVTLPSTVSDVRTGVFHESPNLQQICCLSSNPCAFSPDVLSNTNGAAYLVGIDKYRVKVVVPSNDAVNAYRQNSDWSRFEYIQAIYHNQCAEPEVTFANGKLDFTCATDGAMLVIDQVITSNVSNSSASNTLIWQGEGGLPLSFTIACHAELSGYNPSSTVLYEVPLAKGIFGDINLDGRVDVGDPVTLSRMILGE